MAIASLFKTTTREESPLDSSGGGNNKAAVSDFLTIQALTNFAAMTGSITTAWRALQRLDQQLFSGLWVPYAFAGLFGLVSIVISLDGLKKSGSTKLDPGTVLGAAFIAMINALVLASAVIGADSATSPGS